MPQNTENLNAKMLTGDFTAKIEQPVAKEESPKQSIYWALAHALEHCEELSKTERSRELSLVMTKIEEAQLWYERIYIK